MPSDTTQTISRAMTFLDCFTINKPSLGVRELARMTNLSSSTVGRLLASLRDLGVLIQDPETKTYSLGGKVLAWANVYSETLDVSNIAHGVLSKLYNDTRETISLYVIEGDERVCVERMESQQNVRIVARIGRRLPLYAGSAGKVFLAYLPSERRDEILNKSGQKPFTPNTISDRNELLDELEKIRVQGYAVSHGEWTAEASGIAAPIFNQKGEIIAALTISGPTQRFTPEKLEKYAVEILGAASEISSMMGYYTK